MDFSTELNAENYQAMLTNHLDRLVDFYVNLYAAEMKQQDVKNAISILTVIIANELKDRGISADDIKKHNVETEILDLFQVNYSYGRTLKNTTLLNGSKEEKEKQKRINNAVYELRNGRPLYSKVPDDIISTLEYNNAPAYKDNFAHFKTNIPCLHQILASDILKSPSIDELIPKIITTMQSNRRVQIAQAIDEESMKDMLELTKFYPERIFLGLRYVFPDEENKQRLTEIAFSIHHLTSNEDLEYAMRDVHYQCNKFKSYYHQHKSPPEHILHLERLKSLAQQPCRGNKYIKQLNSIENTFMALCAWRKINIENMSRPDAINDIAEQNQKKDGKNTTHQDPELKKKIRDRLLRINKYINAQDKHNESLMKTFKMMHPEYHEKSFVDHCHHDVLEFFYVALSAPELVCSGQESIW